MQGRLLLRMIGPTLAVGAILLLVGGVSAWYLHRLQRQSSQLLVESVTKVRAAEELELIAHELRSDLQQFLLTGSPESLQSVSSLQHKAGDWIAQAQLLADSREEAELVSQIKQGYDHFFRQFDPLLHDDQPLQRREMLDLLQQVATQRIEAPASRYRTLNQLQMSEASRRNQMIADRMGMGLLLLGVCGAVAGMLAGSVIARSLHRALVQLSVPIRDVTGKLKQVVGPVTVSSSEDLPGMEAALQAMSERVGRVLEQLRESELAAARSERLAALGQLAAGLAHELRNPLTAIKLLIQSAAEQGASASLDSRDLAVLEEEIDRLDHTLQTFLDYARPPKSEKCPVVVHEILQQTVEFVSPQATQRGVHIECELPDEVVVIDADPGQIRQVLLNLLLNAFDASPEGGTVRVRLARRASPVPHCGKSPSEQWIKLDVADSGKGIPPGFEQRVFEPFFSTKDAGSGLGLPICRRIVEEHGGTISVEDLPRGGALFSICLPVGAPRPQPDNADSPADHPTVAQKA